MRLRRVIAATAALGLVVVAAGCGNDGDDPGSGNRDPLVVRGTHRVAGDLPMVSSVEVRTGGSTTTLVPGAHVDRTVTLLWITGDPMDVFDRLAEEMGFGRRVTATRACLVRGEDADRVLVEDDERGRNGGLWCVVEGGPGHLEVSTPVGHVCLDSRLESKECPVLGLARVERPAKTSQATPDAGPVVLHSEQRWRELLGRAEGEFTPLQLTDEEVADVHRPTGVTDHIPTWPSPGDRLDERSGSGPPIPTGVRVLTPVAGFGDCPYGVVVSSTRPVRDVIEDYLGSVWDGDVVRDGGETFVSAASMSAWARGVGGGRSSTVLLEWGCPT